MLRELEHGELDQATRLLAAACPFDAAAEVAEEVLFGPTHDYPAHARAAVTDVGALAGVVVVSGPWVRLLAVHPAHRGRGLGSALLAAAEAEIARAGHPRVQLLGQPGNYLAPGIDVRNRDTIAWLERRGYQVRGHNTNLLVDVRRNPRVSVEHARALAGRLGGYEVRRATRADAARLDRAIAAEFSRGWAFTVGRALECEPPGVHVALHHGAPHRGELVAFAAHDGNNRGLGWFGPAGTWPAHRGRGLGAALLVACLVDVARAGHDVCEIAWIGPREFYQRAVGICGERRFAVMKKELS